MPGKKGESVFRRSPGSRGRILTILLAAACCLVIFPPSSGAQEKAVALGDLIREALEKSPEILAAESRAAASAFRIPQAKSLPDPMLMIGYQNEGWERYTYGDMPDAQWMFSASQMFPFPGKLSVKGEMASRDAEGLVSARDTMRLRVVARVRELYHDLFRTYKDIDLLKDLGVFFSKVEDAAVARYSAGKGMQQEVLMAQREKYMLLEREEMLRQKVESLEAMLNTTIGREVNAPLGRPEEPVSSANGRPLDEMLRMARERSPEIRAREKMVAASEAKVRMARLEYYPDFTISANVMERGGGFEDMWSVTTAINIPLYYRTKQRQGVYEAEASLAEARRELEAARLMISAGIRDNYAMARAAERLMDLYRNGLIPKTYQDFEAALAGYIAGGTDALTVITRLQSLIDFELLYWAQFAEREKAFARMEAIAGVMDMPSGEEAK